MIDERLIASESEAQINENFNRVLSLIDNAPSGAVHVSEIQEEADGKSATKGTKALNDPSGPVDPPPAGPAYKIDRTFNEIATALQGGNLLFLIAEDDGQGIEMSPLSYLCFSEGVYEVDFQDYYFYATDADEDMTSVKPDGSGGEDVST